MKILYACVLAVALTAACSNSSPAPSGKSVSDGSVLQAQASPSSATVASASPPSKCELAETDGGWEALQKALEDWENCKEPRPPSPVFVMPAKGSEIARDSGRAAAALIKGRHDDSGLSRSYWLGQGLTLEGMAEIDTKNIVFECYSDILPAQINNDLQTEEWTAWEHLDGAIYKGASNERGETWSSQFEKHFMVECLKAASSASANWDRTTSEKLSGCSDQYSGIVSLDDVWVNKPWLLQDHCDI